MIKMCCVYSLFSGRPVCTLKMYTCQYLWGMHVQFPIGSFLWDPIFDSQLPPPRSLSPDILDASPSMSRGCFTCELSGFSWFTKILLLVLSREWMGCWGLLGWLLIVSQWIIPENSLRLAPVSTALALRRSSWTGWVHRPGLSPSSSSWNRPQPLGKSAGVEILEIFLEISP